MRTKAKSNELFLGADECSEAFREEPRLERFAERLVDARTIEAHGVSVVRQKRDENHFAELSVASQILQIWSYLPTTDQKSTIMQSG